VPKPTVYIVGADKGGVGKTTITETLLDYLNANGIAFKAYDTQTPDGALKRVFNEAEVVDLSKSDDQVKVFDSLSPSYVSVIDVQANSLRPTLALLSEIGFLDLAKQDKLRVVTLHVLGPGAQSLSEVQPIMDALQGSQYIPLANHINDTEYTAPEGALHIPKLDELAAKAVDNASQSFATYVNANPGKVLSGKVRNWEGRVFEQFNAAKLNVLQ
jgi:MinD-like ATPase involved in chromosome partitioning or flagellar assembly